MTTRRKDFDCVEMKARAQAELLEEFERRKGEFSSYSAFLDAKMNESPKMAQFWRTISKGTDKVSA